MNLVRCRKGHYFDGSKYASCPHCGANLLNRTILTPQKPSGVTVTNTSAVDPEGVTVCRREVDEAVTVARNASDDDLRTIAKYSSQNGTRMVVGWLLCTEGADRGADYIASFWPPQFAEMAADESWRKDNLDKIEAPVFVKNLGGECTFICAGKGLTKREESLAAAFCKR